MREGNKIIKYGITNDPERREAENIRDRLGDTLRKEGPVVSEDTARNWEQQKIEQYEQREGRRPPGNK